VDDALQPPPGIVVAEHAPGECGAVECAAPVEHIVAEGVDDLGESAGTGRDHVARELVGVDDDGTPADLEAEVDELWRTRLAGT
jgi:hypothetical protein